MSIDIAVRQKGLFKKAMPLKVILGDELAYGAFEGVSLTPGKLDEDEFVAYHPQHIARGFSVGWSVNKSDTNKQLECNDYAVRLVSITKDAVLGELPYNELLNRLDKEKFARFDAGNIIIQPLTLADMEALLA